MISDFVKVADMPKEVIENYKDKVPVEVLEIWENQGLGTFLNGYLKVINPDDYSELVRDSYFRGDIAIPIFATAFGDIITWEENEFLGFIKYKFGTFDSFLEDLSMFLRFLSDQSFTDDYFELPLYTEAIEKYGLLDYDQCFSFVPLLALGGFKDVDHLDKVKMYEHILLITALVGKIE
ncbi:T6SS immunity protein Tdi1 domain-containing protein [Streptococcus parasanguinis]|uniref:T6SS immunity protein Tdi1 domain-containing protein n=1 Tax=Streptococcus parasanguinis TaxID=1318 RepID=UPI00021BC90F|nr:T6SS immunity protein Tdi1 domain-containing protein [Streptococcus parasanguinis]EGU65235.1 hypothetical protein HMPREF9962_1353 [Streptococcus parasanguinis SK236]